MGILSLFGLGAGRSITYVGSNASYVGGPFTTLTIYRPTGTAAGDIMISWMTASDVNSWTGPTTPTTWTEILDGDTSNPMRVIYRIATAADISGSGEWTVTHASTAILVAVTASFRYCAYDTIGSCAASANPTVAPQITAAQGNSLLLACYACTEYLDFGAPSGMSYINGYVYSEKPSIKLFSQSINAGATGTKSSVSGASGTNTGVLLSLKPA